MSDILKIAAVFIFILILLRKKLNIGYVMLMASGLLGFFVPDAAPGHILYDKNALIDKVTIKLALALTMIKSF